MGRLGLMRLPLGVADPLFMGELALELGMPVGEMGQRMSNYELNVFWPAYFQTKAKERRLEEEKARRQK
jgi:hypothetical protein